MVVLKALYETSTLLKGDCNTNCNGLLTITVQVHFSVIATVLHNLMPVLTYYQRKQDRINCLSLDLG